MELELLILVLDFSNDAHKVFQDRLIVKVDAEHVLAAIHSCKTVDIHRLLLLDSCMLLQVVQALKIVVCVHLEWACKRRFLEFARLAVKLLPLDDEVILFVIRDYRRLLDDNDSLD